MRYLRSLLICRPISYFQAWFNRIQHLLKIIIRKSAENSPNSVPGVSLPGTYRARPCLSIQSSEVEDSTRTLTMTQAEEGKYTHTHTYTRCSPGYVQLQNGKANFNRPPLLHFAYGAYTNTAPASVTI